MTEREVKEMLAKLMQVGHDTTALKAENDRLREENAWLRQMVEKGFRFARVIASNVRAASADAGEAAHE